MKAGLLRRAAAVFAEPVRKVSHHLHQFECVADVVAAYFRCASMPRLVQCPQLFEAFYRPTLSLALGEPDASLILLRLLPKIRCASYYCGTVRNFVPAL